jgi:integrase
VKKFRKSIRIDGKLVSKEFTRAEDAKAWYSQLHSKKVMGDFDLISSSKGKILFKEFALGEFMEKRRKHYPPATWKADEQRLRDHVLPVLGSIALSKLKGDKLRAFLSALVEKKGLSPKTRDRIQALVSVIYTEAINREAGALVNVNPTYGLTFRRGKRKGVKPPSFLQNHKDVVTYMRAARDTSRLHLGVGALGLLAGLRKQEMIALRFGRVDLYSHTLEVSEKFEQASGKVLRGTKGGEDSVRHVPMPPSLENILEELRNSTQFSGDGDYVLQDERGHRLSPKQVYAINAETCKRAGLSVTVHGLRHTFGREFAERSGNMNALKDIMGHSNFSTTALYSKLGKDRLSGFKDVMDLDF